MKRGSCWDGSDKGESGKSRNWGNQLEQSGWQDGSGDPEGLVVENLCQVSPQARRLAVI